MSPRLRDAYGFEVKKEHLQLYQEYAPLWEKEERERTQRWVAFLLSFAGTPLASGKREELLSAHSGSEPLQRLLVQCCREGVLDSANGAFEGVQQLKILVQAGIPGGFRSHLWQGFLGVGWSRPGGPQAVPPFVEGPESTPEASSNSRPGTAPSAGTAAESHSAAELTAEPGGPGPLQRGSPGKAGPGLNHVLASQIEKDLHRTFPGHPLMDQEGRAVLRQLLLAYGARNPDVGYCQGMNFIAGGLLLFLEPPDAFGCLCTIVEELLPGYFSNDMIVPQVDQLVFRHLVEEAFPRLASHLEGLGAHVAGVSTQWFLCLFVNSLPLETCLRVWDLFFYERCASILFRVGLALVDIYSQALLCTKDSVEAFSLLQHMAPLSYDSSRLVDVACIAFSHVDAAKVQQLRGLYERSVRSATEDDSGAFCRFGQPVVRPGAASQPSNLQEGSASQPPLPATGQLFQIVAQLQEEVSAAEARRREMEAKLQDLDLRQASARAELLACAELTVEKEDALADLVKQAGEARVSLQAESHACSAATEAVEKQQATLTRKESLLAEKNSIVARLQQRSHSLSQGPGYWQSWTQRT